MVTDITEFYFLILVCVCVCVCVCVHTCVLMICCVSLVSTRKEARWSFRFFSLFTVDDEEYVQQTNKQN